MEVRIFIESTFNRPAKHDGVAMWLIECKMDNVPITRKGFIHLLEGTDIQASLRAFINAFCLLNKSTDEMQNVTVFTSCDHILNTINNHWHIQWAKNGWHNAKGKPVKNADLWQMVIKETALHAYTVRKEVHEYQKWMQTECAKELKRWNFQNQ